MRVINPLPIGFPQCEGVGVSSVRVTEQDRVIEQPHTVKSILLPLLIDHEGQLFVVVTAGYVGRSSESSV